MKKFNQIKALAAKFRFFFRFKISILDLDTANAQKLIKLCQYANINPINIEFKRTFNNVLLGSGYEFIGFYPVFRNPETGYSYFSESNEID